MSIIETAKLTNMVDIRWMTIPLSKLCHTMKSPTLTDETLEPTFPYAQIIGSLQFAALTTRLDIAYAVNNVAQFKNHPTTANCKI